MRHGQRKKLRVEVTVGSFVIDLSCLSIAHSHTWWGQTRWSVTRSVRRRPASPRQRPLWYQQTQIAYWAVPIGTAEPGDKEGVDRTSQLGSISHKLFIEFWHLDQTTTICTDLSLDSLSICSVSLYFWYTDTSFVCRFPIIRPFLYITVA